MWEQFFNWQSDMDWTWGPFVSLRPPQNQPMPSGVWVRLFLILSITGIVLVGLLMILIWQLPAIASAARQPLPQSELETIRTLRGMYGDPATQALLIGLIFVLPPLFFIFCLPYHEAWNRRAARLQEILSETIPEQENVWPPAPD